MSPSPGHIDMGMQKLQACKQYAIILVKKSQKYRQKISQIIHSSGCGVPICWLTSFSPKHINDSFYFLLNCYSRGVQTHKLAEFEEET